MKRIVFFLFVFFLGGACGFCAATLFKAPDFFAKYLPVKIGEFLDTDFLYLKSGELLKGQVLSEDPQGVLLRISGGSVLFKPSEVKRIERNFYTRYLKACW